MEKGIDTNINNTVNVVLIVKHLHVPAIPFPWQNEWEGKHTRMKRSHSGHTWAHFLEVVWLFGSPFLFSQFFEETEK